MINSAGVGRTGTFIAVDCLMQEATASDTIDVFESVLKLRSNRNHMVQNLVRLKQNPFNLMLFH